jgi:hypothetical protein
MNANVEIKTSIIKKIIQHFKVLWENHICAKYEGPGACFDCNKSNDACYDQNGFPKCQVLIDWVREIQEA